MNIRIGVRAVALFAVAGVIATGAFAQEEWSSRSGDLLNTGNAGDVPELTRETVRDLKVLGMVPTRSLVNATPVVGHGLLVIGDWYGNIYVVDLENETCAEEGCTWRTLLVVDTGTGRDFSVDDVGALGSYLGVQSSGALATVTVPDGAGGTREERRVYVAGTSSNQTLWCLDLDKILEDRAILNEHSGEGYFCEGEASDGTPFFPRSLASPSSSTMNGSPMFSKDQPIMVDGELVTRDVLYTPTTGVDCSNGEMWAIDARTGELYWSFDPVENGNGAGGVIWTMPAMNAERTMVYVTTGNCVGKPQVGEMAEALVALDATTGEVVWHHQRRLVDTADLDIGNGPLVADVPGEDGCRVVVSPDKDGCIYGFHQEADIPEVGDLGYDPVRIGQQRLLYRPCFVPGSLNGGFNAGNMALSGRYAMMHTSGTTARHVGGDDVNAFALDVCTGRVHWASSDISNGRTDAAAASGMFFQLGVTRNLSNYGVDTMTGGDLPTEWDPVTTWPDEEGSATNRARFKVERDIQVVEADSGTKSAPEVLATVELPYQPSLGGGGPAIAGGRIYAPTVGGVAVVGVVSGSDASPPKRKGNNVFAGPYPFPFSQGPALPMIDPENPYPLMLDKTFQSVTAGDE